MPDQILISEIFGPTVQGEGAVAGQTSLFIRTFGCSYRCTWCDSMHAVDPYGSAAATRQSMTPAEICDAVRALPGAAKWITLTGGDPVAWDLADVIAGLKDRWKIAVETQGALWDDWLDACHLVTVSPKGPSSGMVDRFNAALLQKYQVRLRGRMVFKIAIFNDLDLDFAERIHKFMPDVPLYLSGGTDLDYASAKDAALARYKWLVERVLCRPKLAGATVLPQLHVLVWGRELGR